MGRAEKRATLTIVANNHMWGAGALGDTLDVFPDERASKANVMPITSLTPSLPDFEKVIETCGGTAAKRGEAPGDLCPR